MTTVVFYFRDEVGRLQHCISFWPVENTWKTGSYGKTDQYFCSALESGATLWSCVCPVVIVVVLLRWKTPLVLLDRPHPNILPCDMRWSRDCDQRNLLTEHNQGKNCLIILSSFHAMLRVNLILKCRMQADRCRKCLSCRGTIRLRFIAVLSAPTRSLEPVFVLSGTFSDLSLSVCLSVCTTMQANGKCSFSHFEFGFSLLLLTSCVQFAFKQGLLLTFCLECAFRFHVLDVSLGFPFLQFLRRPWMCSSFILVSKHHDEKLGASFLFGLISW